jgi:sterol 3beta-glucosyltransferase
VRVTILTYGTRGDVEPFLALSQGLIRAGHSVRLAAPQVFESEAAERDVDFVGFPGDLEQLARSLVQQAGLNIIRMVAVMSRHVLPLAEPVLDRTRHACRDADVIVHAFLTTMVGHAQARRLGVADVSVQFFPVFAPTAEFPSVVFPNLPLGPGYRRWSHRITDAIYRRGSRLLYRIVRLRHANLPTLGGWPFRRGAGWEATPLLYAFSPNVVPPAADWGRHVEVTGYWYSEVSGDWKPPRELLRFLDAGRPPVYVGFGSVRAQDEQRLANLTAQALTAVGQRGVLTLRQPGGRQLPPSLHIVEAVPHRWLFSKVSAVVHHGGAGTTGAGLQAGVPNVVVPFTADQAFWGARVRELGVGPKPIPAKRLTAKKLANALDEAAHNSGTRRRAEALGRKIRSEDGVARAVARIESLL